MKNARILLAFSLFACLGATAKAQYINSVGWESTPVGSFYHSQYGDQDTGIGASAEWSLTAEAERSPDTSSKNAYGTPTFGIYYYSADDGSLSKVPSKVKITFDVYVGGSTSTMATGSGVSNANAHYGSRLAGDSAYQYYKGDSMDIFLTKAPHGKGYWAYGQATKSLEEMTAYAYKKLSYSGAFYNASATVNVKIVITGVIETLP